MKTKLVAALYTIAVFAVLSAIVVPELWVVSIGLLAVIGAKFIEWRF